MNQSVEESTQQNNHNYIPTTMRNLDSQDKKIDLSSLNNDIEQVIGKPEDNNSMMSFKRGFSGNKSLAMQQDLKEDVRGSLEDGESYFRTRIGISDSEGNLIPYCRLKVHDLMHYGETLYLYFYLMRFLTFFFGIIAMLYSLMTYVNFSGNYLSTDTMETYLDFISLANFYGYSNMTTNENAKGWNQKWDEWKYMYYYIDLICTTVIFIMLIFMKMKIKIEAKKIKRQFSNNYRAVVQVNLIQQLKIIDDQIEEIDIRNHFQSFGMIMHVSLIRDVNQTLHQFTSAGIRQRQLQMIKAKKELIGHRKVEDISKVEKLYDIKLEDATITNLQALRYDQFPLITAIIHFESEDSVKKCLDHFNKKNPSENKEGRFIRSIPISVSRAIDPTLINFEFYQYSQQRVIGLSLLLALYELIILAALYLVCYTFREYLLYTQYDPACKDTKYLSKTENDYASSIDKQNYRECFCSQFSTYQIMYGSKTSYYNYCYDWTKNFMNTWLPLILINANNESNRNVKSLSNNLDFQLPGGRSFKTLIMMGQYESSTRDWIKWFNFPICSIIVLQWIFTMILSFLRLLYYKISVTCKARDKILMSEFHKVCKGMKINMSSKLAQICQFLGTIFVFSGAYPGLFLMIPIYLGCFYAIEKFLCNINIQYSLFIVLKCYRIPPKYEITLLQRALNLLLFSLFFHMAFTLWVFSEPLIFPKNVIELQIKAISYYYVKEMTFYDRVFTQNGFQYFVMICSAVILLSITKYLNIAVKYCLIYRDGLYKQLSVENKDGQFQTRDEVQTYTNYRQARINNLTYDIHERKRYKRAISLLNESQANLSRSLLSISQGQSLKVSDLFGSKMSNKVKPI
ncbi:trna methyltransferase [Stylonychia lemnae]|uniref:Trna methyltransferase n=1 Tax=Stylonychia lemnae TaxID=5949 RepID=A0A077ZWB9_STYLE|nr:trna methyltransferase [Stylonychia lemnae]|eukprot:CDW73565.1 trna methyltransferase [Stylonychia lemnae]